MDEPTHRKKHQDKTPSRSSGGPGRGAIAVAWIGLLVLLIVSSLLVPDITRLMNRLGVNWKITSLAAILFPYVVTGLGSIAYGSVLPRHQLLRLFTDNRTWDRGLLRLSAAVYTAFLCLTTLLHWAFMPGSYRLLAFFSPDSPSPDIILIMWGLALVLIPMQTSVEEILFRLMPARFFYPLPWHLPGYPKGRIGLSLFSALLFVLPHLANPEVTGASNAAPVIFFYALFGFGVMYLSLVHKGFEIALGIHAANNLMAVFIVSYPDSALPAYPLLMAQGKADSWWGVIQLALSLITVAVVSHLRRRKTSSAVLSASGFSDSVVSDSSP
ncbi:CPBP family intramembrane glutamic endopeptidase [Parasphaerochaeta coccoides]|uniref:Abortive infection protein n=1 Tax=Parasphaerochaeta coccoides (strain ATCC BAA-1237 / DSM 17374 / SPN1) TaxID=760011 RepID=F4GI42_PARC1|nr:CPBP family intramembrane glutamic endopeptidase [Parasphaerochaeta coccoides]AEC02640.1 Abortive infection protein [Parasphaerochaeta coccoides DSM 17374]